MWTHDLARDLEIKHIAIRVSSEPRAVDAAALVADLDPERLVFLQESDRQIRFEIAPLAQLLGDAWVTTRLADGESVDADALEPFLRRIEIGRASCRARGASLVV